MSTIIERIQAKLELLRLEKRYTRHRSRRSTFVSNAIYVDGEYVYQNPLSTGSSNASTGSSTQTFQSSQSKQWRATQVDSTSTSDKIRNRLSFNPKSGANRSQEFRTANPTIDERY